MIHRGTGAGWGIPWAGPVVLAIWLVAHFTLLRAAAPIDARLLVATALLDWATDSALVFGNFIVFATHAWSGPPSPLWMLAIWIGFAATLRQTLLESYARYMGELPFDCLMVGFCTHQTDFF